MSRRCCFFLMGFMLLGGPFALAQRSEPDLDDKSSSREEIRRLMNRVKKSPQPQVVQKAWEDLFRLGFQHSHVKDAIKWEDLLLSPEPAIRFEASRKLAHFPYETRVTAIGTLRNLIAAEREADLIWMHAVTLSSIDTTAGSALQLIQQIPHDPILHDALNLQDFERKALAQNERKNQNTGGAVTGQFVRAEDNDPFQGETYSPSPVPNRGPPPPPRKIPAPPLIARRQFDEILKQIDQGSDEARELFRLYGEGFPQASTAKHLVARAFGTDWRDRHGAIDALWDAGPDAELAAALCYAVIRDLCLTHQVEMIARIEQPEGYSLEVLKQIRHHSHPNVRIEMALAIGRASKLDPVLVEMLIVSCRDKIPELRAAALRSAARHRKGHAELQTMIEQTLLLETHPAVVSEAASGLEGVPLSAEYRQSLFQSIDVEKPAETNLILIDCLLAQAEKSEDLEKRLRTLQNAMQNYRDLQRNLHLQKELQAMIGEAESVKERILVETIEELRQLELLTK